MRIINVRGKRHAPTPLDRIAREYMRQRIRRDQQECGIAADGGRRARAGRPESNLNFLKSAQKSWKSFIRLSALPNATIACNVSAITVSGSTVARNLKSMRREIAGT